MNTSSNDLSASALVFYTLPNFAGSSMRANHGDTGPLASASGNWNYQSIAISAMSAFCWSAVNTADASINYQNHIESLITFDIADLTKLYADPQFPMAYLGINPALVTPIWLDMNAVSGSVNALAAMSVVGAASTSITTLSRSGNRGIAGFIGLTSGSSLIVTCSYGSYNADTGQVAWTGLNASTLVFQYINGLVTLLSATGFPSDWTFPAPVLQPDGSWVIAVNGGAIADNTISSLTSDKDTIANDGKDQAMLTATVQDADGNVVEGVSVSWATDLGTLNHKQQVTDNYGLSHAKLSDQGDTGVAVVTATLDNGACAHVKVTIEESAADIKIVSLSSDKSGIINNGTDSAMLTAEVHDSQNVPVAEVTVNWSTTLGNLSVLSSITNSEGQATVILTDTGDTGTAVVTGTLDNGSTGSVNIVLTAPTLAWTDVTRAHNPLREITVDEDGLFSTLSVPVGARLSRAFSGGVLPVYWSSSKATVASVDENGTVTITGRGKATITLTDSGNNSISYIINTSQSNVIRQVSYAPGPWQDGLPNSATLESMFYSWGDFYNDANACGWQGQSASNFYFWSSTGSDQDPGVLVKMAYWTVNLHMNTEDVIDWPNNYHYLCDSVGFI